MLELQGVSAGYGPVQVLRDVSLTVEEGEVVGLVGANGAGKSTTLKTILGLLPATGGTIRFLGEPIDGLPSYERVARGIAGVPEGRRVFPHMTVLENLEIGAYTVEDKGAVRRRLEHVYDMFPILARRRSQLAGTMSGGEQQMVAIGRALMSGPKLLMLDEPSLGLAPKIVSQVMETVRELARTGLTILLVEQNVRKCLEVAQRAYVLENGRVALGDASEALLADDRVREAYLGV